MGLFDEYKLSGTLAVANAVMPLLFKVIGFTERYDRQDAAMTVEITRSFFMRIGSIYAIFVALYSNLDLEKPQFPESKAELWGVSQDCCAGTVIGQEAYKMVITDIVFTMLAEVVIYLVTARYVSKDNKIEMDVAQALVYVCYRQGLIWIGMLFAPPLAFLGMFGAWLSFHIYYQLATRVCKPSQSTLSSSVSFGVFNKVGVVLLPVPR